MSLNTPDEQNPYHIPNDDEALGKELMSIGASSRGRYDIERHSFLYHVQIARRYGIEMRDMDGLDTTEIMHLVRKVGMIGDLQHDITTESPLRDIMRKAAEQILGITLPPLPAAKVEPPAEEVVVDHYAQLDNDRNAAAAAALAATQVVSEPYAPPDSDQQ